MIITLEEYKSFAKSGTTPNDALTTEAIQTAQMVIEEYLGYSVDEKTYTETFNGIGTNRIYLSAYNVNTVALKVNGIDVSSTDYTISSGNVIALKSGVFSKSDVIDITYKAGFSVFPASMKITCRLITQAIIANFITSTTNQISNGGSTITYADNTKYYKFFSMLDGFRIFKV